MKLYLTLIVSLLQVTLATRLVAQVTQVEEVIKIAQVAPEQIPKLTDAEFSTYLAEVSSQYSPQEELNFSQPLPSPQAKSELYILKRVLEEAHTPMYRFANRTQVDSCFRDALADADAPMDYLTLVAHISRLQHLIACGHSSWGHNKAFFAYRNQHIGLFPFDIKVFRNRFYLVHNNSLQPEIPENIELVKLNGVPIRQLASQLRKHMYADGNSTTKSWMDMEKAFPNAYANFIERPERFSLTTRWDNREGVKNWSVQALRKSEIDSIRSVRYPPPEQLGIPLQFKVIDSHKTGVYTIKRFRKEYIEYKGQDFEAFTDSVFTQLQDQKLENLIIDLRDNAGGWTAYGKYLLSYLIDQPHPYMQSVVTQKPNGYSFDPIVLFPPGYEDTFQLKLNTDQLYTWTNYPSLLCTPQPENRFKGNVYILINNYSRSCSAMFSALAREHTKAVFIGEETGSMQCGAGGMVMGITLPYSGLQVYFSTAQYTTAVHDPSISRGVIPDIRVQHTLQEWLSGEDIDFWRALDLIH